MYSAMLNRRRLLGMMGATATLPLLGKGFVSQAIAADGTVTIAYNVNLPSFDPTVGASAVNPTIQALFQAIFDPYVGQEPNLKFKPGLLTDWGWSDDKTKVHMTVREGATWHNGDPVTAEDVVWSLERAGNADSGNPIQFIWSTSATTRSTATRSPATCSASSPPSSCGWASSPATCCRRNTTRASAPRASRRSRSAPAPTWSTSSSRTPSSASRPTRTTGAASRPIDTVIYKFIPDPTSRVAELEVRLLRHHARDSLRGVRPAEGEPGLRRLLDADLRHRDDLPQRRRPDARQERPPRRRTTPSTSRRSSTACSAATASSSTRCRRRNIRPSMRRSRSPTTPPRPRSCSPRAASRPRTRSSSRSRPPAASSRRTTR